MLNYLDLDTTQKSVDWGVLAVYTCSQNCCGGPAYKQEFLWKQDIVSAAL
jgi:Programmed cell death protein 2, C-terminal putative domain.